MAQLKDSNAVVSLFPEQANPDAAATTHEPATTREAATEASTPGPALTEQTIDDTFNALKTLLTTMEKLQKARQSVGDIKGSLVQLLDGEMLSGGSLEQVKAGIGGLGKLIKLYGDYQVALAKAQPARDLLDGMLMAAGDSDSDTSDSDTSDSDTSQMATADTASSDQASAG